MHPTLILRHNKENLRKCSLTPLQGRHDLHFLRYPKDVSQMPIQMGTIVLVMGAPELPFEASDAPLLLIDGTWRYAARMWNRVQSAYGDRLVPYSLPHCITAYPRYQTACDDPEAGLASVEALYLAYACLGRSTEGLLDHYHWREEFLERNQPLWDRIAFAHRVS